MIHKKNLMIKRRCSIFLFIVFMSMMGQQAFAEWDTSTIIENNGWYYYLDTGYHRAQIRSMPSGKYTGNITIPSSFTYNTVNYNVTSIGYRAFDGCSGLTSVTIPNSVTSIGDCAFLYCSSLTSVTIGNSVTSIGDYAFEGCSGLTSVTIPNCVTIIGYRAFKDCTSLESVTIGNSVKSINYDAFMNCSGLTSVTLNSKVFVSKDYNESNNMKSIFGDQVTEYIIGDDVTSIGYIAFKDCTSLETVTIGNNVTSIGYRAFDGCSGLTSVTIPNSVTSIDSKAFKDCTSLESVTIGNSVTRIHSGAFDGCSSLESVILNSSSIVKKAYASSSNMKSIFGDQVTEYIIGDGVTRIGDCAFYGCSGLTSVTIPNSVTSIGDSAFDGCSSLTSVTVKRSEPAKIYSNTFSNRANAALYVPKGSKAAYQTADSWKEFKEIIEISLQTHKLIYVVDGQEYKTYNIKEEDPITPEAAPTKDGYTFSGWSEIPSTMPAYDVTITGTFAINQYTITYKIDDEVYQTESVDYGSTITPPNAPEREGYTFEWIDVPETMPAHDITIVGSYTSGINAIRMEAENGKVFDLNGRQVKTPGKGVYIINGQKVVVK